MGNPNQYPNQLPVPEAELYSSVQLELTALQLLAGQHEALELELLCLGRVAIAKTLEIVQE